MTALTDADQDILFGSESSTTNGAIKGRHRKISTQTGAILPDNTNKLNPLDHSSDPLVNKLRTMRETIQSCPLIWKELSNACGEKTALIDDHLCDTKINYTFSDVEDKVRRSAAVFTNLGVNKGKNVAILGENSAMWLIVDHGIQLAGGASAVRGADAPGDELRYIYEHSDSAGIVVLQDVKLLQKLAAESRGKPGLGLQNEKYGTVKTVILMHRGKSTDDELNKLGEENGIKVKVLNDLLDTTTPANYK